MMNTRDSVNAHQLNSELIRQVGMLFGSRKQPTDTTC